MPKLAALLSDVGRVEIPVQDDEPLIVEFRRKFMTPRLQAAQATIESAPVTEQLQFMTGFITRVVASWNLTGDDGEVIPLEAEALSDVSIDVLALVARAIGEAMTPDPLVPAQSASRSSNGSSPKAVSARRRTTTD